MACSTTASGLAAWARTARQRRTGRAGLALAWRWAAATAGEALSEMVAMLAGGRGTKRAEAEALRGSSRRECRSRRGGRQAGTDRRACEAGVCGLALLLGGRWGKRAFWKQHGSARLVFADKPCS